MLILLYHTILHYTKCHTMEYHIVLHGLGPSQPLEDPCFQYGRGPLQRPQEHAGHGEISPVAPTNCRSRNFEPHIKGSEQLQGRELGSQAVHKNNLQASAPDPISPLSKGTKGITGSRLSMRRRHAGQNRTRSAVMLSRVL